MAAGLVVAALAAVAAAAIPTAEEIKAILDAHNEARADVSPSASNMVRIAWSDELAGVASRYAERCIWEHSDNEHGENLAIGTSQTASGAIISWNSEVDDWTYAGIGQDCRPGRACGHYTQNIWAESTHVGCGRATCNSMQGLNFGGDYTVCNYSPPGNYIRALPYTDGPSCSACPGEYSECDNNLCVNPAMSPEEGGPGDIDAANLSVGGSQGGGGGSSAAGVAAGVTVALCFVGIAGIVAYKKWKGEPIGMPSSSAPAKSAKTPYLNQA